VFYPPGVWLSHTPGFFFWVGAVAERAVLFIDGNNWYHGAKQHGIADLGRLDYGVISRKLVGPRQWCATRYYVGQVEQRSSLALYAAQRRFIAALRASSPKISVHFGRLESRPVTDNAARELKDYLTTLSTRIDQQVYRDLYDIARRNMRATAYVEKAVDVFLAVDMVVMAERDEFDTAYLLSADGDFTPAVDAVRAHGKRVLAASAAPGARLAAAVNTFIRLGPEWFHDCYR
jgi:uncharacterized LabA/DUF88 family protein